MVTLTFTRNNKQYASDSIFMGLCKIFRKMSKFNKFIIPLALVKIILAFLVLQLFFSSCEQEEIFYDSDIYTDGPLFEIEASLATRNSSFESLSEDNYMEAGDTLFLQIALESNTLYDEISKSLVTLSDPEFYSQFVITDKDGSSYIPSYFVLSGEVDDSSDGVFSASFKDESSNENWVNKDHEYATHLKLGFVLNMAGSYTFHFINTPNSFLQADGAVDIYYERNPADASDFLSAYAVYVFQLGTRTQDYGRDDITIEPKILYEAEYDQAIIDFTVIEKN